jgi:hypothetical protein
MQKKIEINLPIQFENKTQSPKVNLFINQKSTGQLKDPLSSNNWTKFQNNIASTIINW